MPTSVAGIGTTSGTGVSTATTTGSSALGKDEFLKLLLAQLSNQDPTAPSDNQQFVAQLAQFSSLEQAQTTNSKLDSLLVAQASANQTATASFIGKNVLFKSTQVGLTDTGGTILGQLAKSASTVTATITDSKGKVVRTINLENVASGALSIPWNGLSDSGAKLANGTYTVALEAKDASGQAVSVQSQGRAKATGVTYAQGYAQLIVNGLPINMSEVIEVSDSSGG